MDQAPWVLTWGDVAYLPCEPLLVKRFHTACAPPQALAENMGRWLDNVRRELDRRPRCVTCEVPLGPIAPLLPPELDDKLFPPGQLEVNFLVGDYVFSMCPQCAYHLGTTLARIDPADISQLDRPAESAP
jgi:hypothetical protein